MKKNMLSPPTRYRLHSSGLRRFTCASFAVASLLLHSLSADAQVGTIASFDINISSSEQVLAFPNDPMVMHFQSWDSPLTRIIERNMPFIEVTNSLDSTVNMTEFRFTIGDTDFNFTDEILGGFALPGETSPFDSFLSTTGGDELVIQFGSGGLAPGQTTRFQVDINPDPGVNSFVHPDYRTVFFDIIAAGQVGSDEDNSVATGVFALPDDGTRAVSRTLQDVSATGPVFVNGDVRPYSVMEMVEFEPVGETEPIPGASTDPDCIELDQVDTMGMINDAISISNDGDVGTAIDVLSYMVVGADADLFDLKDFAPSQLIGGEGATTYGVLFTGAPGGDYDAQVIITTSEGDLEFNVCANVHVIPEPATAGLLAFGSVGLALIGRRRRR